MKIPAFPAARTASRDETAYAIALVLGLVTLSLYWPVLGHEFIDFDDDAYVTANPMVLAGLTWQGVVWAWTTNQTGNWHPLTWLSHMMDCSLFGNQPAGHHATSALLHTANTVLLFLVLRRMTGTAWRAAAVAALFGWHPLHVESVAWVAERKDVLSTFFFLWTIWFYAGYARDKSAAAYRLSLLCFVLALLSKPMVVTLPFVLLVLDYWPLERFAPGAGRRLVLEKLPFLGLAAASCAVTYFVQKGNGNISAALPLLPRAENIVLTYGHYLSRMIWPARLAVYYPFSIDFPLAWLCVCLLLLVAMTLLALKCHTRRFLATGWFWYLGTLVPVIGLVQMGAQSSADRYTYIPLIGIFLMIVWGVADLAIRWRLPAWAPALAGGFVLAACAAGTERQLAYWTDSGTLFRRALAVTTNNAMAWNSLGIYVLMQGDETEAMQCFSKAVVVEPDNDAAWYNLGVYYWQHGRNEEALRCFTESMRFHAKAKTSCHVGLTLNALHRPVEAQQFFAKALALDPNYLPARMSLADSLSDQGHNEEAAREYREVLRQDPGQVDAHYNLACILAAQGQKAEAMTELQQALRLRPSDASAHCGMGNLLMDEGKLDQAADEYRAALRAKPGSPEIHSNLGAVLALQGRRQQAMEEFNEALRLAPNFTQAKERLKALTDK